MKRIFLLLALFTVNAVIAQKNTGQISLNGGVSVTTGNYSMINFNSELFDQGDYPFEEGMGGAQNGYSIGVSTSYFFSKYLGLALDWNYLVHDIESESRQSSYETYYSDDFFEGYNAEIYNGWSHNSLNIGAHAAFPFANDKFAIDFKSMVGFSSFVTPGIKETINWNGVEEIYSLSSGNFTSLSTKFELGFKFFIKDFGIGLYVNSHSVYTDQTVDGSYTIDGEEIPFKYLIASNPSMLNYGLNLTYRLR